MSDNEMIGAVVGAIVILSGLYFSFRNYENNNKKEFKKYIQATNEASLKIAEESKKVTEENTKQLILLNNNFEHMRKADNARDKKLEEHGCQLDDHELRLTLVENTKYKKEYTK